MRKRQEMGLNQLRTKRSGVRVPPGAPAASCRSQVANLTLWGSRFFLPAFFIDIYFITLTHVAANPCGSPHFSAQNAASPFGLVSPAGSVGAERSPPGSSTAPLREKSRSARLLGCKRPRLRLTVATNFSRLKGIVLWVSISSPQPSGKLPLPSRESHFVGFAIFVARVCV